MKTILLDRSLPKWTVLLIDLVILAWAFIFSFLIIQRFDFPAIIRGHFFVYVDLYCLISLGVFYMMRVHRGLIRYSSTHDVFRIFVAVLITSLAYGALVSLVVAPLYHIDSVDIYAVLLINFFIATSLLTIFRIGIKRIYMFIKKTDEGDKDTILIYGANAHSILVMQALEANGIGKYEVAGFLEENPNKVNKTIHQKKVYPVQDISELKNKLHIDKLVVLSEGLSSDEQKRAIDKCLELGLKVQTVPPTDQWMSGELRMNQIQDLRIEDLLQRPPIVIENAQLSRDLVGKRVLVSGGAGSIGYEIVRQVLNYHPESVIICDQAESPLHELQLELEETFPNADIKLCIGDIQNFDRMYALFNEHNPHIVYHAAAYKHVPMMENNPSEAILTNVQGTKNLADLSVTFGVDKFVMVSTDKAVNPTNIMGTTKRIAEIYVQSLNNVSAEKGQGQTKFITTRFGNVLGSNGSVIPRFRDQIQKGGPITVTHPDITRYFMTIPEAVQLVLEAGTMGKGGEIFIFDMGEPVKIVDLAAKMIKLAGLTKGVDIDIVFSGLRPGEKLYEELLNEEETTVPTHHKKIKISKVREYEYSDVLGDINELLSLNKNNDEYSTVRKMKKIVPEFLSKNSRFEELDVVDQ